MSRRGWALFVALSVSGGGLGAAAADPAAFDPSVVGWPRVVFGQLAERATR
jgi:hypothetical protein